MFNNASYILFYHRITPELLSIFEWQLKFIKKNKKISTIYNIENIEPNSVIITFDDGFFDNFVYAYPLLKKYEIPATVFLSTCYVSERGVRHTIEDVWNKNAKISMLQKPEPYQLDKLKNNKEFLTWEEIKIMHKSGLIAFESHGHEHLKHQTDKFGEKSSHLQGFRYFEEKKRFETEEERSKRLSFQFSKPKQLIKQFLGVNSEHFCWQWGEYDNFALEVGKQHGYKYFYTTKKGIINKNYSQFPRISVSFNKRTFLKRNFIFSSKQLSSVYTSLFGKGS